MSKLAMNYQPHQPPKTFKLRETVYGKQKRANFFCNESEKRRLIFNQF